MEYDLKLTDKRKKDKMKPLPYFVNSFAGIGWTDPFPDEHSGIEKPLFSGGYDPNILIYPESRYRED